MVGRGKKPALGGFFFYIRVFGSTAYYEVSASQYKQRQKCGANKRGNLSEINQ